MHRQEKIEQALSGCYDAITTPGMWADALHGLARSVDSVGCSFYPKDAGQTRLSFPASHGYRAFLEEFLRDDWWRQDHRAPRGWALANAGQSVILDHDITSDEERETLPQYRDLYARHDVPWWAAVFFVVDDYPWALPLFRSKSQGPFTREDAEQLVSLRPHLERLLSLAKKVAAVGGESTINFLEHVGCAAMLVDWRGKVFCLNARAEALLGTELVVVQGALSATRRNNNTRLQHLISQAIAAPTASAFPEEPAIMVRTAGRPLLVDAIPLSGIFSDTFLQARALLLVSDLEERPLPPQARLRSVFGLTPGEARVAAMVVGGEDLHIVAEKLHVAKGTVRAHLKMVFAKTETRRQADLVALLSHVAAAGRR